jgi:hypothetical protein
MSKKNTKRPKIKHKTEPCGLVVGASGLVSVTVAYKTDTLSGKSAMLGFWFRFSKG